MSEKWIELILLPNRHLAIEESKESGRLTKIQKAVNDKLYPAGIISG